MINSNEISQIEEIGIKALRTAKVVHDELGEDGLIEVPSANQFNERALKVDVESEKVVLEVFRESNFPIRVFSEEHGIVNLSEEPEFFGTLDGIDGSSLFQKGKGRLRYATALSIALGIDHTFGDYAFSGIMEHATNRLWIGVRGQGSFLVDPGGNRNQIHTSSKTVLDRSTRIYAMSPEYNDVARRYLTAITGRFKTKLPLSEAIVLVDIASGEADLALEVTRKGNIEQMAGFGLVTEAGGNMYDRDGNSIANQKFLKWGQQESQLLITSATPILARSSLSMSKGL